MTDHEHRNTDELIDKALEKQVSDAYDKSHEGWVYVCTWDEQDSIDTYGKRVGMLCHKVVGYNQDVRWLVTSLTHFVSELDRIASEIGLDKPEQIIFDDEETISWIQYVNGEGQAEVLRAKNRLA